MNNKEFKQYGGYYYLGIVLALFLGLILCSCKTTKETIKIDERIKSETTLNESRQKETSNAVSGSFSQTTEATTDKETRLSGGSLHLSPPDSTGKQFPAVINWYRSNTTETSRIASESVASLESRLNSTENRLLSIEKSIETKTESKTDSKSGFTFLEKTGLAFSITLFLTVVFFLIKWYLKIKK